LTDFQKKLKYQISLKSVQWEPSLPMHMDRQTYMTQLKVAIRNCANMHKNCIIQELFKQ